MSEIRAWVTIPVTIDPEAWRETYDEEPTQSNVAEYLRGATAGDVWPAHDEWGTEGATLDEATVSFEEPQR